MSYNKKILIEEVVDSMSEIQQKAYFHLMDEDIKDYTDYIFWLHTVLNDPMADRLAHMAKERYTEEELYEMVLDYENAIEVNNCNKLIEEALESDAQDFLENNYEEYDSYEFLGDEFEDFESLDDILRG